MTHVSADDLIEALRSGGLRVTAPRRAICEVLAKAHDDHLSAGELHSRAEQEAGSKIDQSTIYRTIDVLESTGHVQHVHLGHGPAIVHLKGATDHHHLVCEVCGRAVDVPFGEVAAAISDVASRYEFTVDSVHFALIGRCTSHETNGEHGS